MQDEADQPSDLVGLTTEIIAAYVSHNRISRSDLPELISSVHRSLSGLGVQASNKDEKPEPRLPIKKTVTPDYLVSLEDGKHYRSLKRHLTAMGLTPEMYRAKWGLPYDYPMVAANYTKMRSELAKSRGLGQLRAKGKAVTAEPAEIAQAQETEHAKPRRGRGARAHEAKA